MVPTGRKNNQSSVHVSSSIFSCQRAHIFTPTSDFDAGPMSTPPFFPDVVLRCSDLVGDALRISLLIIFGSDFIIPAYFEKNLKIISQIFHTSSKNSVPQVL